MKIMVYEIDLNDKIERRYGIIIDEDEAIRFLRLIWNKVLLND